MLKKQISIINTDFVSLRKDHELWLDEREKKRSIYRAYLEYIEFLETLLDCEKDIFQRVFLKREIQRLRKEQGKYYVPSILEMSKFGLTDRQGEFMNSLEKSSFSLVKRNRGVRTKK